MNQHSWKPCVILVLFAIPVVTGCNRRPEQQQPPPPVVAAITIKPEKLMLTTELPGRTCGYLVAEIRPQVNGLLQKRLFTEGAQVAAGQILYEIDPSPYKAALEYAEANLLATKEAADRSRAILETSNAALERHRAVLSLAKANLQRYENLVKTQAASAMQRDQSAADVDVANSSLRVAEAQVNSDKQGVETAVAAIKQAEAAVKTARINLGYTKITAPISGRIGRSTITEGAIVTAYQAIPVAIIQQFDPIYVDVPQSTVELNRLKRNLAGGRLKDNGTDEVKIVLEDGTEYPLAGSLKFRDVTVDPTTGSVILRIEVKNPDGTLLPGMFVRAVIEEGVSEKAIVVPQQAVTRDPKGNPYVMLVQKEKGKDPKAEAKNIVKRQPIVIDRVRDAYWIVSSGLSEGDRVIVEGLQMARPGVEVKVVPFKTEAGSVAKSQESTDTFAPTK
jgi:membrane fusion protein (multidrug efflux system)